MKTYTMSFAAAMDHKPVNPERTARKSGTGRMDFDITFKVWPNRASLAKTVRLQQKRERLPGDWEPCVKLEVTEGY